MIPVLADLARLPATAPGIVLARSEQAASGNADDVGEKTARAAYDMIRASAQ